MSYCIIETGSKQYRVKAGDTLEVDRLESAEAGKPFTFERVLMVSGEGDKFTFGNPAVSGASVVADVVSRAELTVIKIKEIKL